MSQPPDIAVVVIAYNEASTIEDCLGALLAQETALSLEVLVVDDGSTDGTADVVASVATGDPRVRLVSHAANRGRGAARRTGQDAVVATFIGYVDADVIVPVNWIAACTAALGTYSAVSGIASPDGDCVVLVRMVHPVVRLRRHTMAISGGNVVFRADALRSIGFDQRARLGEDFRLATQMTARGMSIATLPDLVAEHREHKSYARTIHWMWQNGIDASRLPFELQTVRLPDVTWLGWLAVVVVAALLGATGTTSWWISLAIVVVATVAVALAHAASRFVLSSRFHRWLAAAALDVPLISAYLAGRTVGLPGALVGAFRRPPAHSA